MRKKRNFVFFFLVVCVVINVQKDETAESRFTVSVQHEIIDFLYINCKADASETWEKLLQISRRIHASSLSFWVRCNVKRGL